MNSTALTTMVQQSKRVGGIYRMGYSDCDIITNDMWRQKAGGIPQGGFLFATRLRPGSNPEPDDHIILLRVLDLASLPIEEHLHQTRAQAMRDMVTGKTDASGDFKMHEIDDVLDIVMRKEIQFSGLKARVLGTMYEDTNKKLCFTQSLDDFIAASHYYVYKPDADSLGKIVNTHSELPTNDNLIAPFPLGLLRESQRHPGTSAVNVNAWDFISQKTAVLGMTRMGKSNTLKQIAAMTSALSLACKREGAPAIGQLIFDPMGEYSFPNDQDKKARLGDIGKDAVIVYSDRTDPRNKIDTRPLKWNFFDPTTFGEVWPLIETRLLDQGAVYTDAIAHTDFTLNGKPAHDNHVHKRLSFLKGALLRAGFEASKDTRIELVCKETIQKKLRADFPNNRELDRVLNQFTKAYQAAKPKDALVFLDAVVAKARKGGPDSEWENWLGDDLRELMDFYKPINKAGYKILKELTSYHDSSANKRIYDEIIDDLHEGNLVIVDLSGTPIDMIQRISESIVHELLQNHQDTFTREQKVPRVQVFLEEAHTLFRRGRGNTERRRDAYHRLAKEAAKLNIGLVYATQEITEVDDVVKNNTANWIITRFNNTTQLNELARYEDFEDFKGAIRRIEEIGLARVKTASNPLTIPIQIAKFTTKTITAAAKGGPHLTKENLIRSEDEDRTDFQEEE